MSKAHLGWGQRQDANSAELDELYRAAGCSVQSLGQVKKGCPDRLIGVPARGPFEARNMLVEYKTEVGSLTSDEEKWLAAWRGEPVVIVRNAADVWASLWIGAPAK